MDKRLGIERIDEDVPMGGVSLPPIKKQTFPALQFEHLNLHTPRAVLRVMNPDIPTRPLANEDTSCDTPPPVTPLFWKELRAMVESPFNRSGAISWYLDNLASIDERSRDTMGLTDLENILTYDSRTMSELAQWKPTESLGRGSYEEVILWVRERGGNLKSDQVACKDAEFDRFFKDYCAEAHLTRKLNAAGCPNVVKVLDWITLPKPNPRTRILYEYCPYGTLHRLLWVYEMSDLVLPEAFIWHIFHSIASAICYNANGAAAPTQLPDWHPIIHRDIKPDNILLDMPDPNNRTLYPTLKLADYGLAYSVPNNKIRRLKRAMWCGGTLGYVAPENNDRIRSDPSQAPNPYVSPRSDIYSLGCVILACLRQVTPRYLKESWSLLDLDLEWSYEYYPYSRALVDLARRCIIPNKEQRPTPYELYSLTNDHAKQTYNPIFKASKMRNPEGVHAGLMLWTKEQQNVRRKSSRFRDAFRENTDWFIAHEQDMSRLQIAATRPGLAAIPPADLVDGVSLGNGLGGFCRLADIEKVYEGLPREFYVAPLTILDHHGNEVKRKNRKPFLRFIAQDRLHPAEPQENWLQKRMELEHEMHAKEAMEARAKVRADALQAQKAEEKAQQKLRGEESIAETEALVLVEQARGRPPYIGADSAALALGRSKDAQAPQLASRDPARTTLGRILGGARKTPGVSGTPRVMKTSPEKSKRGDGIWNALKRALRRSKDSKPLLPPKEPPQAANPLSRLEGIKRGEKPEKQDAAVPNTRIFHESFPEPFVRFGPVGNGFILGPETRAPPAPSPIAEDIVAGGIPTQLRIGTPRVQPLSKNAAAARVGLPPPAHLPQAGLDQIQDFLQRNSELLEEAGGSPARRATGRMVTAGGGGGGREEKRGSSL